MATGIRFASIIVTYRCNARCHMCNTWQHPTDPEREIGPDVLAKLPFVPTVNITGGEPFLREDLEELVTTLRKHTRRVVISSNGFFVDRILALFRKHPWLGIRISIEGMPKVNDELRGLKDGFDHGLRTLIELDRMGIRDIGFGMTVSDRNMQDLVPLHHLAQMMGLEFSTAAIHNSFYFHKFDNKINGLAEAETEFHKLIADQLRTRRPKDWFRAYFNHGLLNYIHGRPRLLPCRMGTDAFFLDPYGRILPCNVLDEPLGNLCEDTFDNIWSSSRAQQVRQKCNTCTKNCWMMGSVGEQIKKHPLIVVPWVLRNKLAEWWRRRGGDNCDSCERT